MYIYMYLYIFIYIYIYIRVSTVALKFLSCLPARLRPPSVGAFVFVPVYVVLVVSGWALPPSF